MELVTYDVPWKPIVIAPIGDIQWAGRTSDIAWDHLKRHIDAQMERGAWFIGMGDYVDFMSPSNRKRLAQADLYDTSGRVIQDKSLELTMQLYDQLLAPTKGRWLGLLEGHHYSTLESGATTDQKLAELLETKFLGTCAYVRLVFVDGVRHASLLLWTHHGTGGGAKAHAPILKLENLAPYWEADIFLIGHMTKMAVAPIPRVEPSFGPQVSKLRHRHIYLVGTGGWLKGYAEESKVGQIPRGPYVEQRMLNPVVLGAPTIVCQPRWSPREGGGSNRTYIQTTVAV